MGNVASNMRLLCGCVAIAASDTMGCVCKLLQVSFCSAVTWPSSFFASVDAAGATVDIRTSSCTPLVQFSSDQTHVTVCPLLNCQSRASHSTTEFFANILELQRKS